MNPRTTFNYSLLLLALLVPCEALAQGARLQLGHLDKLAAKAEETVDVTVDAAMLKETAGFFAGKGSDTVKAQQMLQGITGIYVKSFEFNAPNAYTEADVEVIRKQLAGPGWSRIVGIREKGRADRNLFVEGARYKRRTRRDLRGGKRVDSRQHCRPRRSRVPRRPGADDSKAAGRDGKGPVPIAI